MFGSLQVDANSPTPYTDATQVREMMLNVSILKEKLLYIKKLHFFLLIFWGRPKRTYLRAHGKKEEKEN